jgi:signal transduction histidine kinase
MNLMEWAQSQTGRMEFNPEHFEMQSLINETELLFEDIAVQKNIIISKVLPTITSVYADKVMIGTVLRNLITNALKFTEPGGKIMISVEEKQNGLTVSVADTGVGIPKNRIETLFRIDESYSTPGTNNEKGTGLGLILCKEFIEKHGGRIWVESDRDGSSGKKGTTFHFTLPKN